MPKRDGSRIFLALPWLLGIGFVIAPATSFGEAAGRLIPRASGGSNVEWALAEAQRVAEDKLAVEGCRAVFSEFLDADGHPLEDRLQSLGLDSGSYLRKRVLFYSGIGSSACGTHETIAFTTPGSAAVFVCSTQFVEKTHRDPGLAAALLIHEELHSLGLGENPPSSKEITARVIARCGK
jgi:hypothetical protein